MFSSTIIPTVGRATLSRAVHSVLEQGFDAADFEVVVVNDSGESLPAQEWQQSPRVRVIATNRRERSVARNAGAAVARGKYLHFLDDDDVILPGALRTFWQVDRTPSVACWICGDWQTVDDSGKLVDEFRPALSGNIFSLLVSGEGLPLQASLVKAAHFFAVGGFDQDPGLIGVEDRDLGRRMALAGAIGHAPAIVAQVRIGRDNSTTDWGRIAARDRWGREKSLRAPGAFARLRTSAPSSYWRGRVSRAYLASTAWNLRRWNVLTAASRLLMGLAIAGWRPVSPSYWRGLGTKIT